MTLRNISLVLVLALALSGCGLHGNVPGVVSGPITLGGIGAMCPGRVAADESESMPARIIAGSLIPITAPGGVIIGLALGISQDINKFFFGDKHSAMGVPDTVDEMKQRASCK